LAREIFLKANSDWLKLYTYRLGFITL
jgi:hypothetical protein